MSVDDLVEHLCRAQHDAYEAAARRNNWATQLKSRVPWSAVPEENKQTMRDSMRVLLGELEWFGVDLAPARHAARPTSAASRP